MSDMGGKVTKRGHHQAKVLDRPRKVGNLSGTGRTSPTVPFLLLDVRTSQHEEYTVVM